MKHSVKKGEIDIEASQTENIIQEREKAIIISVYL